MGGVRVRRIWERRGLFGKLLWLPLVPLSGIYFVAVRARNLLYGLRLLPRRKLPRPVLSVGNLSVGGTGKTPTALWLSQELQRRGYRVAILSRGYKRNESGPILLESDCAAEAASAQDADLRAAGDEPAMMARIFGQRVGVGKNRYKTGIMWLQRGPVDLFILDDGFQHRRLKRDVDLLLLGSDSRGSVLPAGPFREPKSALRRAHLYLVTGSREDWEPRLKTRAPQSVYFGTLKASALFALEGGRWKEYPLALLNRSKILTVCGIADPGSFYRMIHSWDGDIVDTIEFPDHHEYLPRDWQRISRGARAVDLIVTTEKDILKLVRFPFAREKLFALRVEMAVENGAGLIDAIEARLGPGGARA